MKELKRNPNYLIDEYGNIYSKRFKKLLNPKHNHDGYLRIQIWKNNKCEFVSVHRLVAETFIENPLNKPFVNHKDGNKQNNHVSNLEWCTQKENIKHAWSNGLSTHENHSKYGKVGQYDKNNKLIAIYDCPSDAAEKTGICYFTILNSAKKNHKARKDYYFRFVPEPVETNSKECTPVIDTQVEAVGTL